MIHTATQLKAKVRNLSGGNNERAKVLIRNYFMERFLERMSLSSYRDRFILKGGMLVAAVVGLETRATMDIDATVKSLPLTMDEAYKIVEEIISVELPDGILFEITNAISIMEGHDYPGIRFILEGTFDMMRQTIKIDISTGDVIIPRAIEFRYRLMFENRTISIMAYNMESQVAEKLETIMARGTTNTRMRDFYDAYIITERANLDADVLKTAFLTTSEKRGTSAMISEFDNILEMIETDTEMQSMWEKFAEDNYFVGDIDWNHVIESIRRMKMKVLSNENL